MASFERYDVVRVPFPFTDRQAEKNRPALVILAFVNIDPFIEELP